jgi:hypothetical protein
VASKKQGTCASADSVSDTVPADETIQVPQHFINGTEFKIIDVGDDYKSALVLANVSREAFVTLKQICIV